MICTPQKYKLAQRDDSTPKKYKLAQRDDGVGNKTYLDHGAGTEDTCEWMFVSM